ncbi:MAG: dCTP deaminase domain-containing protein [Planctomycetota bacterium]
MIVDPNRIIKKRILTSPLLPMDLEEQVQPNGIDVRIREVGELPINMHKPFKMWANGKKYVPQHGPCEGTLMNDNPAFVLKRGYPYTINCYEMVEVPVGLVAMVYGRSTLHRNGVFCRSAVYDAGFHDHVGMMMFPFVDYWVEQQTRVAQIVFFEAKGSGKYDGQYGLKKGDKINVKV